MVSVPIFGQPGIILQVPFPGKFLPHRFLEKLEAVPAGAVIRPILRCIGQFPAADFQQAMGLIRIAVSRGFHTSGSV